MYELTVDATFSSAHNIRGYEGACENLHGHNWKVEVTVRSESLDSLGMVVDFKVLKNETKKVIETLDHKYLNEVGPFKEQNATAENIARHLFKELSSLINGERVRVFKVRVWESETSSAAYLEG